MDIIFENSYTRTKELLKEVYNFYYFKRSIYIILDIVIGLSFLVNVVWLFMGYNVNFYVMFLAPLFFVIQFFQYFKSVNTIIKRDYEINKGSLIHVNTIVTEHSLKNTASTGSKNEVDFSQIKKAVQTKNLILLRSQANLIYILRKDTFTKGTCKEFIEFLNKKGFKL